MEDLPERAAADPALGQGILAEALEHLDVCSARLTDIFVRRHEPIIGAGGVGNGARNLVQRTGYRLGAPVPQEVR